jgi:hypothetical protein
MQSFSCSSYWDSKLRRDDYRVLQYVRSHSFLREFIGRCKHREEMNVAQLGALFDIFCAEEINTYFLLTHEYNMHQVLHVLIFHLK